MGAAAENSQSTGGSSISAPLEPQHYIVKLLYQYIKLLFSRQVLKIFTLYTILFQSCLKELRKSEFE